MNVFFKIIFAGLLAVMVLACSSSEDGEPEPEPEPEPSVMDVFPEEVTVQASQIKDFEYQSDYDAFFGIGRTDMLWITFEYEGRDYLVHTETPPSYDSAKKVNTMTFIDNPVVFDESKPAVLDSVVTTIYGGQPYLWGVSVREYNPFTVIIEELEVTDNPLPGKLKKITFHVEQGVPFHVVQNDQIWDRRENAEFFLQNPEYFALILNEEMQCFTNAPRHSVPWEFQ